MQIIGDREHGSKSSMRSGQQLYSDLEIQVHLSDDSWSTHSMRSLQEQKQNKMDNHSSFDRPFTQSLPSLNTMGNKKSNNPLPNHNKSMASLRSHKEEL